jgi:hypothetical protein
VPTSMCPLMMSNSSTRLHDYTDSAYMLDPLPHASRAFHLSFLYRFLLLKSSFGFLLPPFSEALPVQYQPSPSHNPTPAPPTSLCLCWSSSVRVRRGNHTMPPPLPPLPSVSDLIRLYGARARQELSQNFILDLNVTGPPTFPSVIPPLF